MKQGALSFTPARARTRVTLYRGDCLEVMPRLAAGSVQMVFADLPYGVTRNGWDVCLNEQKLWQCLRKTRSQNCACIFTATNPFASTLITSNRKEFRYDLVWYKNWPSGYFNANRQPLRSHELILVFSQKKTIYNPQKTPGKPYILQRHAENLETNYGKAIRVPTINAGNRFPLSVLQIARRRTELDRGGLHPSQKPVALLEWLIKTYTNPGDTVLDPTAGSGTTAIAAMRTGRHAVCIEKDPAYFEIMRKRVQDERERIGQ